MFEIRGVSTEVMTAFSTRSAEIEAALGERGTSREEASAAEKQVAALDTRQAKVAADQASLVADWRATADRAGFDASARLALVREAQAKSARADNLERTVAADRAVAHAADKLGERQSVFSVAALHEEAGRVGLGRISYAQIGQAIETASARGDLIDRTFLDPRGAEFAGLTTRQNIEADSIRFTRNDREAGRVNGSRAEVITVDVKTRTITVRGSRGQVQTLHVDTARDRHITHGYVDTAFAAQGRTAEHVIVHADSRATNLVDQKSFYVGISRAKQSATIYTNDRAKLVSAINERAGRVQTAIAQAAVSGSAIAKASTPGLAQTLASRFGAGL